MTEGFNIIPSVTFIRHLHYGLIAEKYHVPVARAEETLTAGADDDRTARILDIAPGAPVLDREAHTTNNRIIETRTSKGRSDRFSYKTEIR